MREPENKGLDSQEEGRLCVPEENCGRLEAGGRSWLALLQVISNTHRKHACNQQNIITHIIYMYRQLPWFITHAITTEPKCGISSMEKNREAGMHMMCAFVAHCIADWQSSVALQSALVFAQQP